jgi:thymidylate synthase
MVSTRKFSTAWFELLSELARGRQVRPRGMLCFEETAVTLRVLEGLENVLVHPARNLNYRFMVAEWLWIWFGRNDVASISRYNSKIAQFSDDGTTFEGAYGPRIVRQWPYIIGNLKRDPDSRQAVISIFSPRSVREQTRDVPCTLTIQFLIREKQLETIVCMRSSDVWLGLPYDFFNFSMLANSVAAELAVPVGRITMHLGSSHLYERNFDEAQEVLKAKDALHSLRSPAFIERPSLKLEGVLMGGRSDVGWTEPWSFYNEALSATKSSGAQLALFKAAEWR